MYNTDLPSRAELPSARRLAQSTVLAVVTAGALLVTVVAPAEYGLDPTGVGRMLGLTTMGEIKASLEREARRAWQAETPVATAAPVTPVASAAPQPGAQEGTDKQAIVRDRTVVTLKPGQAAEVKLEMSKGHSARFDWSSTGAVNFDNHGDPPSPPPGFYHGYGKGRQVMRDSGTIIAAFDGLHGFFWRNRGNGEVTIQLNTEGRYGAIKRLK